MNHQLSIKEKKRKRSEDHRRVILWSECKICEKQLKQTQARVETISLSDSPASASTTSRYSDLKTLNKSTASVPIKSTVFSLQKTIRGLKIQRQGLDVLIKFLTNHLHQFSSQKTKSLKRNKPDEH